MANWVIGCLGVKEEIEVEVKPSIEATKAIVYDLPSENQLKFKDGKIRQKSVRVGTEVYQFYICRFTCQDVGCLV